MYALLKKIEEFLGERSIGERPGRRYWENVSKRDGESGK
jgi:hypothetical protein